MIVRRDVSGAVLDALIGREATVQQLSHLLDLSPERVAAGLVSGLALGQVIRRDLPSGSWFSLTAEGLHQAGMVRASWGSFDGTVPPAAGGAVDGWRVTRAARRRTQAELLAERERGVLVDPTDRDAVVDAVSTAYAEGRIDKDEHDRRAEAALESRTLGELRTAGGELAYLPPAVPPRRPTVTWIHAGRRHTTELSPETVVLLRATGVLALLFLAFVVWLFAG